MNSYIDMRNKLSTMWGMTAGKYRQPNVVQGLAEKALLRDTTYAKIALVAKVLKDVGAINLWTETEISSPSHYYGRSVVVTLPVPTHKVFILNGGDFVIVTDSTAVSMNTLDRNLCFLEHGASIPYYTKLTECDRDDFSWCDVGQAVIGAIDTILMHQENALERFIQ